MTFKTCAVRFHKRVAVWKDIEGLPVMEICSISFCVDIVFEGLFENAFLWFRAICNMCRQLFPESDKPIAVSINVTGS